MSNDKTQPFIASAEVYYSLMVGKKFKAAIKRFDDILEGIDDHLSDDKDDPIVGAYLEMYDCLYKLRNDVLDMMTPEE